MALILKKYDPRHDSLEHRISMAAPIHPSQATDIKDSSSVVPLSFYKFYLTQLI